MYTNCIAHVVFTKCLYTVTVMSVGDGDGDGDGDGGGVGDECR